MEEGLVLWGDKNIALKDYEAAFMDEFTRTHNLDRAYRSLPENNRRAVKAKIKRGTSDLAKAFKDFIENAPVHPRANRVAVLDTLVWAMEKAKEQDDTQGVIRAIQEINKMIKGNLVNSQTKEIKETKIIGVIDLSKPEQVEEEIVIDVTPEENGTT